MDDKCTNLITVLGVPNIHPNIQDQSLVCVIQNHKFTKQLQLADNSERETSVDVLIDADLFIFAVCDKANKAKQRM